MADAKGMVSWLYGRGSRCIFACTRPRAPLVGQELMHVGLGDDAFGQCALDRRQFDGLADIERQRTAPSCQMMDLFRRLACFLGFHDFRVVEVTMGFGPSGAVEKVECRRCGHLTARRQRDS